MHLSFVSLRNLLFCILLPIGCLLSTDISLKAQELNGTINFSDGSPCKNATIQIVNNLYPNLTASGTTNAQGEYTTLLSSSMFNELLYASADFDHLSKNIQFKCKLISASNLRLAFYDINGKEIYLLLNQACPEGIHNFSWNYASIAHHIKNRICFINFKTNSGNRSIKFTDLTSARLDFYKEENTFNDLNLQSPTPLSYSVTISGDNFPKHHLKHVNITSNPNNFTINNSEFIPFKCGQKYIEQHDGISYKPFYIKGINLGAAIPGTSPAEMAPTSEQYAKWFQMMSDAGYNLIRIYTLHYPRFYQELKKFNDANPAQPLYLMHGAWLDEEYEGWDGKANLYSSEIEFVRDVNASTEFEKEAISTYFDNRVKEVIDVVHGKAQLPERWGWASGNYDTDVSPWLLGYIIGREIYANEVFYTNDLNPDITSYQGSVFSLAEGSAIEVWATERLDKAMNYEKEQYLQQHPISFSSWPTLDPIEHPTENGPEDWVSVNLDGIDETNAPAGYFASYHVYPYFPDFMVCDPEYQLYEDEYGSNSYLGYLHDLKTHYPNRPLIISEFGVSSSWGTSRYSSNGMHHGGLSEEQQGQYIVRMMNNIQNADCGGGILFSWIDEWFKYVWLFGQQTNPATRNRWHNIFSAEENYGLISFIPNEADFSQFGYGSNSERIEQVRMSQDIEALYIKVKLTRQLSTGDTLWLALDTYNKGKGEAVLPNQQLCANRPEFCISITPTNAQLYVTKAYDLYGIGQNGYPKQDQYFRSIPTTNKGWNKVIWKNHRDEDFCAGSEFDAGNLKIRNNNNPMRGDAVIFNELEIILKLPWAMIHFNDPSQLKVVHITDYKLNGGSNNTQTVESDGVAITAILGNSRVSTPRFKWDKWDSYSMPKTYEQVKKAYYMIKSALKDFPQNPDN